MQYKRYDYEKTTTEWRQCWSGCVVFVFISSLPENRRTGKEWWHNNGCYLFIVLLPLYSVSQLAKHTQNICMEYEWVCLKLLTLSWNKKLLQCYWVFSVRFSLLLAPRNIISEAKRMYEKLKTYALYYCFQTVCNGC